MCPGVSFEVKCIVKAFAAKRAEISLDVTVAFYVSVQKTLKRENFVANSADELIVVCLHS